MLINTLINRAIKQITNEGFESNGLNQIQSTAYETLVSELTDYMQWIFANPKEFADSLNAPTRELFTPKEIIEMFNETCEYNTKAYGYISRLVPDSFFAANGEPVSMSRATGEATCKKMIAIKNQVMWNGASKEDVIKHLIRTM